MDIVLDQSSCITTDEIWYPVSSADTPIYSKLRIQSLIKKGHTFSKWQSVTFLVCFMWRGFQTLVWK